VAADQLIRPKGCYACVISCGRVTKVDNPLYAGVGEGPEYETAWGFGADSGVDNLDAITKANYLCNEYGIDTISMGATIACAMELYERGLLTKDDTDGLELTWGNHAAIVALMEKMARREGFGAVLADGSQKAAERIGRGTEAYAVHIHGQEPPMHDPKMDIIREHPWGRRYGLAMAYQTDAAPGRHTGPQSIDFEQKASSAAGLCSFGGGAFRGDKLCEILEAVTGTAITPEDLVRIGHRIACIRQAFNLREGITPADVVLHPRVSGKIPLEKGPLAGTSLDMDTLVIDLLKERDWDPETGWPSRAVLESLGGLDDVIADLYGG
jgi:aldehyde:ferredoxin oxidoreductase